MEQPPGGPGLAQEALLPVLHLLRAADQADRLDGQLALDVGVLGEVDLAHGTSPQKIEDAVAADAAAALEAAHRSPGPSSAAGASESGAPDISPSSPVATFSRSLSSAIASGARSTGTRTRTSPSRPKSAGNSLARSDSYAASMPLFWRNPTRRIASSSVPTIFTTSQEPQASLVSSAIGTLPEEWIISQPSPKNPGAIAQGSFPATPI